MRYIPSVFLLVLISQLCRSEEIETSSWDSSESSPVSPPYVDYPNVNIAVMGATGSGKTSFINLASGSSLRVGQGLHSCTSDIQVSEPFKLDNRSVTLIDTPGFDDTTTSDADILYMISAFLAATYQNGEKLAGLVYIHRISDFRMTGISTRNFKMFRELCGEDTLKNVIVVTNMWGNVSREIGEAREQELATKDAFFKPVLDKGGELLRHNNTLDTAHNILRHIINNHPLPLQIQLELIDQRKEFSETAAGKELNREMVEQIQKHQNDMKRLQEETTDAIRMKDEETRQELEVQAQILEGKINKVQMAAQNAASAFEEEKRRMEIRMRELSKRRGGLFSMIGRVLDDIFD